MRLLKGSFLLLAVLLPVLAAACGGQTNGPKTIKIRYSRFGPEVITVRAGVPVTYVLRNEDPILHEWIVGPDVVHERHRIGTEPWHDQVPTEISIPAFATRRTTVTFEEPGEYAFVCHLPGHEAYGMRGSVRVLAQ